MRIYLRVSTILRKVKGSHCVRHLPKVALGLAADQGVQVTTWLVDLKSCILAAVSPLQLVPHGMGEEDVGVRRQTEQCPHAVHTIRKVSEATAMECRLVACDAAYHPTAFTGTRRAKSPLLF